MMINKFKKGYLAGQPAFRTAKYYAGWQWLEGGVTILGSSKNVVMCVCCKTVLRWHPGVIDKIQLTRATELKKKKKVRNRG